MGTLFLPICSNLARGCQGYYNVYPHVREKVITYPNLLQVLIAWYVYLQERKRKKARITEALERRREMLLKRGATKWLAVAFDLMGMRQNYAAQQGAQVFIAISGLKGQVLLNGKCYIMRAPFSKVLDSLLISSFRNSFFSRIACLVGVGKVVYLQGFYRVIIYIYLYPFPVWIEAQVLPT